MGGTSLWKVERNTPVPGRRNGFSAAIFSINLSLVMAMVIPFRANVFQPSHQVTMKEMMTKAMARGNQPPVRNFPRQALKKVKSRPQNRRQRGKALTQLQPQIRLVMK